MKTAYLGHLGAQLVGEVQRERHEALGLVGGISEHNALIAKVA